MPEKTEPLASFEPDGRGIVVATETVKEQIARLLDEGYFDEATACVLGVSNAVAFDVRWAGTMFDCVALCAFAQSKVIKEGKPK